MAQWNVEDIAQEVESSQTIVAMNKGSKVKESMVKSLVAKLQAIDSVPPSAYVRTMECFNESSLPEDMKEELSDALGEACAETLGGIFEVADLSPVYDHSLQLPVQARVEQDPGPHLHRSLLFDGF